jgi:transmembrane protein EpsG
LIVTILLGIFCTIANIAGYFFKSNMGLKFSFFLIFIFLGLRYNFGNDYETYLGLFNKVNDNEDIAFDQKMYIFYEPGWMILNWLSRPIGFFGMTLFIALFYSIILYKLIKKYVPFQYYWLAVFFIIFNPGFLLVHSTTMRQTIAILIFILSFSYLLEKKIIHFVFCILIASTFHYTSITLLIISPFLFYNRKVDLFYGTILFSFYIIIFLLSSYLSPIFSQLVSFFSERYEFYSEKGVTNTGLGFIFYSTLFLLTLILDSSQDKNNSLFFKLAIVYFILMPFTLIIEITSRIGMYFSPAIVIVYPFIFNTLKSKFAKAIFLPSILLFTLYQFFQFFYSETYKDYFLEYHTIFSSPFWN